MARGSLPPGFRFHPTDEELVRYYLKRKVMGKSLCFEAITELDLYKFAPWDLPEKSCWQSKDLEWYFVSPRDRKYANGPRTNRATDIGYWKTTGKDRSICHNSRTVGMKKTLVFHLGRAPRGTRTDWVMHEYRLEDLELVDAGISQDAYVLCKIFQKSGPGPKNGEQHGAPFKEEEWEDDMGDDSLIPFPLVGPRSPSLPPVDDQNIIMTKSTFETGEGSGSLLGSCTLQSGSSGGGEEHPSLPECDDVGKLLLDILCNEDGASYSQGNGVHENQEPVAPNINLKDAVASDSDDIFNDLEDITIQEMLSGINNDSYIELKDLGYPREANDDGYGFSDNLFSSFDNLQSVVTTDPEIDVSRRNPMWEFQVGMHSSATPFVQAADVENTHILQPLGEGELPEIETSSVPRNSSEGALKSKLLSMLGSLPAKPAWSLEYPSPIKGQNSKYTTSSDEKLICVETKVTVFPVCACGKFRDITRMCCYECKPLGKKLVMEPSLRGGGFTFMFLLGVVTALMWVFLLAMTVKLGSYAWKFIS
ncbi:uncharacterized protein LOC143889475 isoform X1 [Tasmannia lanceolata]|uniref:uncharacterized protein LOC143889475 isoform X1 n=1 Tax=Tasmannia lanceolata TaxID=3420 RepID=UPI00406313E7